MRIERAADHSYRLNGVPVPGVTRTLSALFPQFDHVPVEVLAAKRELGTIVHAWCEVDDRGLHAENAMPHEVRPFVEAWRSWKRQTGFVPVHVELFVGSSLYRFAGQADVIGYFQAAPSDFALVDRKVVRAISPLTALQTGAYKVAAEETIRREINRRLAVQLRSDGRPNPKEYTDPGDAGRFIGVLSTVNWARNVGILEAAA